MLDFVIDYFDEICWVMIISLSVFVLYLFATTPLSAWGEFWDMVQAYINLPDRISDNFNEAMDKIQRIR
jgi:hypothetical protein